MIQIAIIEDNVELLKQIVTFYDNSEDVGCKYAANSVEKFLEDYQSATDIDILLLDINLPGLSGLDALPKLKADFTNTDIIMFTMNEEKDNLINAFCNGASGYLFKTTPIQDLLDYFKVIKSGGSVISSSLAQNLFEFISQNSKVSTILNKKEHEVLSLLAEGWSYKLIAERTGLSIDGVRFYIKRIYKALDVNSKGEAIHKFYRG